MIMRRNTSESLTMDKLIALIEQAGAKNMLYEVKHDPAYAAGVLSIVNAIFDEARAKKAREEAAKKAAEAEAAAKAAAAKADVAPAKPSGGSVSAAPGSDAEMWLALADLVDSALPELSSEEREALKAAFRAEAK